VYLSTIVINETDGALATKAVGPETAKVYVGLGHLRVGDEEPDAKNGLGEDVENSVRDDLGVDRHLTGPVGDTPDTVEC
jgi:hypothetical protein